MTNNDLQNNTKNLINLENEPNIKPGFAGDVLEGYAVLAPLVERVVSLQKSTRTSSKMEIILEKVTVNKYK